MTRHALRPIDPADLERDAERQRQLDELLAEPIDAGRPVARVAAMSVRQAFAVDRQGVAAALHKGDAAAHPVAAGQWLTVDVEPVVQRALEAWLRTLTLQLRVVLEPYQLTPEQLELPIFRRAVTPEELPR